MQLAPSETGVKPGRLVRTDNRVKPATLVLLDQSVREDLKVKLDHKASRDHKVKQVHPDKPDHRAKLEVRESEGSLASLVQLDPSDRLDYPDNGALMVNLDKLVSLQDSF